jgi:hypothetical protein
VDPNAPLDAERILAALAENSVDYVLIGGLAVQTHGHVRTTIDVDIFPRPEPANLGRLAEALNVLDARVLNPGHQGEEVDAAMLPRRRAHRASVGASRVQKVIRHYRNL